MTSVFIGGSRRIARLPEEVRKRIDAIVEKGFRILVGDASGADKAVQSYLAERAYPNVLVHCIEGQCRNNVGGWQTRQVSASKGARGFDLYSLKDRVMADAAEYGLVLWDGKSKGTINNVVNLSRHGRPALVFLATTRQFVTVKGMDDLLAVLAQGDSSSVARLVAELHLPTPRTQAIR